MLDQLLKIVIINIVIKERQSFFKYTFSHEIKNIVTQLI